MTERELIALVLAVGIACAIVALSLAAAISEASAGRILSEGMVTLLSTSLGAAIGAIATYLGARSPDRKDE